MARLTRICLAGLPQHVIQRGNNRQACFGSDEDIAAYAYWLDAYARKFREAMHAWVFTTNHVHLLLTSESNHGVSRLMQTLGRHYVCYFNDTYRRSGTLWEGRFKSCLVEAENYLLICQRYIALNPVRAGMVEAPAEYVWSSYRSNGLGQPVKFRTPHAVYQQLGKSFAERTSAYRDFFHGQIDSVALSQIRQATNQGMVPGNDRFKEDFERLVSRRVVTLKRDPKPKQVEVE